MALKNSLILKEKLRNSELSIGSWISMASPAVAEIMSRAGFEWLTIDLEHSTITLGEMENLVRTIDLSGVVPLVRLTSNDANQIKRVMDAGAHGVIVPMVNSRAEIEKAIEAIYYPPRGKRGVGLARAQSYGTEFESYQAWSKEGPILIAQIEHIDAVNNMEEIISAAEVDGYIVGPYDLTASMGIAGQFDHDDFKAVMDKINAIGKKLGKSGGLHIVEPDPKLLKEKIEAGFRFMAYSVDFRMLDTACREGIRDLRGE